MDETTKGDLMYLVIWWGGYERPQLALTATQAAAKDLAELWAEDAQVNDTIEVYLVDSGNLSLSLFRSAS
jgi:hypothetical protein